MKDKYIYISGQRCKISELPYSFREKLGLLDDAEEQKVEKVRVKRVAKNEREKKKDVVRTSYKYNEIKVNGNERKESEFDLMMKDLGRELGKAWKKMFG